MPDWLVATIAILGPTLAALGIWLGRKSRTTARHAASVSTFNSTRRYLKDHISDLIKSALAQYGNLREDTEIPLLTRPKWIPPQPIPLFEVALLHSRIQPGMEISQALSKLRRYWPIQNSGERLDSYHNAVADYDKPENWFNGASYRLLHVSFEGNTPTLTFTDDWYWGMLDTTEVLSYEAALRHNRSNGRKIEGRYRRWLHDPFDLRRRCAVPGIDALTIRNGQDGATFYVHRRGTAVATAMNLTCTIPGGEFQPSDDSHPARKADLDLWKSIVREYAEEFLGVEEARERMGAPIDYLNEEPYASLSRARQQKRVTVHFLGIGLDPLTWKPTILTTCVFNPDCFDDIFGGMIKKNKEGMLELPTRSPKSGVFQGWPLTAETVSGYINNSEVLPATRAGLVLVWRFRERLGLNTPPRIPW
ncbi:hypothetical protein [Streptomyces sp. NPDC018972]|uniref:hypothetical protein n=1 Tax=Streptomyces sp. NPDC018972 TaxID=3365060 RepID=UPI00378979F2